jgi:hypothetical protein
MKKILILLLFVVPMTMTAQKFEGFFRGVPDDIISHDKGISSTWLFRPVVQISAMQFILKTPVEVAAFNSLGTGLSYVHFVDNNGEPYANFGVNALVLFSENPGGVEPTQLSAALSVTALQFVNVGVGYNFGGKYAFILTGITINFN